MNKKYAGSIIVISFMIAITFIIISGQKELSNLENIFFQIFILTTSIFGSYLLGQLSDNQKYITASKMGIRRLVSIFLGLSNLAFDVEAQNKGPEFQESNYNFLRASCKMNGHCKSTCLV